MAITDRELKPGMVLTGRYHKVEYTCKVSEKDGKLVYYVYGRDAFQNELKCDVPYKSISAAGSAITGHPCNGWVFWSIKDTEATTQQPAEQADVPADVPADKPAEQAEPVKKFKPFRVAPNQRGVTGGRIRWLCHACRKSFLLPAGQTPTSCPGHPTK